MGGSETPLTERQGVRYALFSLFLLAALGLLGYLGFETRQQLDQIERAPTDNARYIYAQLEVEHLRLLEALSTADRAAFPSLNTIRTRFDIFYSRIDVVAVRRPSLDPALAEPLQPGVEALQDLVEGLVPLIDGPDGLLMASIPQLRQDVANAFPISRTLAQQALTVFGAAADERRGDVRRLVLQASALAFVLVLALGLIVLLLLRVYQRATDLAHETALARARLQSTVGASQDAVLVLDTDLALVDFTGGAERIFGAEAKSILGQPMPETLLPQDQRESFRAALRARGNAVGAPSGLIQLDACRADGTPFPAEATLAAVSGSHGPLYVCFLRDISERRRAENKLKAALERAVTAERAKGEFIAVMSHEMRTPLNGLMAALEILDEQPRPTPKQKRYIGVARSTSHQLLTHVNDVLQISKLESGTFTPAQSTFDVGEFLQALFTANEALVAASGNRLVLAEGLLPETPVRGDRSRTNQILLNLLGNAAKFTDNGTITLACETLARDGDDLMLRFSVQDTGEGIAPGDLARIFEDFVTLDPSFKRESSGTGLGLSIARRLAQALGGDIGVESEPGVGSTFWLDLPFERAEAVEAGGDAAQALHPLPLTQHGAPLEILVVEDNAINRMIAREFIESTGARVTEARDGQEGVELAQESRFDAIFMDIGMPRMDGLTATALIRDSGASAEAPIFGLTAHAQPEELAAFRAAGMQDVLVKPVQRADILALLGTTAAAPSAAPEGEEADVLVRAKAIEELLQMLGEETLMGTFLRFAEETQSVLNDLPETPDAGFAPVLHQLAGSAGSFGAMRFRRALLVAEGASKEGHAGDYTEARADVIATWQGTVAAYGEIGLLLDDGF
ncbi:PAS domain-containing hybrid sensor histidine kinase/response regulator [Pseudoruegeria sp. SHC-113]|uniref:PAS domain-containing hybrid sensor histidine kinase/response regulator n=1 Tax=Pseudoruegeria sp. SHC-113 TaxID=2855439 RepID=UPI0021BB4CE8|nr:PAS domain-containing hybrid sensor histidine kinase/response regulator [Pseudoruegeria sp. SHC-113]MCT8159742.1 response regulator [Pseudoruegeria sp. SHC-113]